MVDSSDPDLTNVLRQWPFIGRTREYDAALEVLAGELTLSARGVLLVGEPGVGKSSLAARVADATGTDFHHVTVIPPIRAQPVMLGALAPLLTDVPAAETTSPLTVFRAVARRLADDANGRPILLRVEDGHSLDAASAGVLHMLATAGAVRLLVTSRPGSGIPDDIVAMWKDGQLCWIDVPPLDRGETSQLLRDALGGVVSRDTDRRMWEASRGNPLYLQELVRSASSRGELRQSHGVWMWSGPVVPGRLIELVTSELRRLPEAKRTVLEIVSLAESLPLPLLFELAAADDVDALVETGMLVVDHAAQPPAARVSHPVYGEAVRSLVPPGRRRELRERVVQHLPAPDHSSLPDLLRWVSWALESGSVPEPGLLAEAAALANHLQQAGEAIRFADLALVGDPPAEVVARARAERARAHRVLGSIDRAQVDLDAYHALPKQVRTDDLDVHAAITGADALFYGHADSAGAVALLDQALQEVRDDPRAAAALRGHRLTVAMNAGETGPVLEEAVEFLNDAALPLLARIRLAAPVQLALARAGRVTEALSLGDQYIAAARESQSEATAYITSIRGACVVIHLFSGDIDAAERMHLDESDLEVIQAPPHRYVPGLIEGQIAMARGRWSEAAGHFRVAIADLRDRDPRGMLPATLALFAESAVWLGDLDEAARFREESERLTLQAGSSLDGRRRRTLLWVGLARREPDAVDEAIEVADWALGADLPPAEMDALHVALIGLADGLTSSRGLTLDDLADRMIAAAKRCHGLARAEPLAQYARAVAAGDPDLIVATETTLTRYGVWSRPPRPQVVALTRREQEIAPLAAAGISSRDIGRRLSISTRTVESHLARIYAKLGISSRADLPAALAGRDPAGTSGE